MCLIVNGTAVQICNIEEDVAGTEPWNQALIYKPPYDPSSVASVYTYFQQSE